LEVPIEVGVGHKKLVHKGVEAYSAFIDPKGSGNCLLRHFWSNTEAYILILLFLLFSVIWKVHSWFLIIIIIIIALSAN